MYATLSRLLAMFLILIGSTGTTAAETWTVKNIEGVPYAVTPTHKLLVHQVDHPNEATWGEISVPVSKEQLPELHKHRKSPNFPFIDVGVDVDGYYRTAQGHIHDSTLLISVEIDRRHWDGLKTGRHLTITLPDRTQLKETLSGSGAALKALDRR